MRRARQRRRGSHAFDRYGANATLRQEHRDRQAYQPASRNENRYFERAGSWLGRSAQGNALLAAVHIGF